jgi:hypothetical protein
MVLPPVSSGVVHDKVAEALPAVAVPIVGVPGTVITGVTRFEAGENVPVPPMLIPATLKV